VSAIEPPPGDETPEAEGGGAPEGGIVQRSKVRAREWSDRLQHWMLRVRQAAPALDLVWEFGHRFRHRNAPVLVGHLTYRLFIWLAPMTLVISAGLGFSSDQINIIGYMTEYGASEETAREAADQAKAGRAQALIIGLGALAFATLGLIRGIHYSFAQIWGIEITPRKRLPRQVAYTILSALAIAVVYGAISGLQRQGPFFALAGAAGSFAVTAAGLWLVCWLMPRRTDRWLDLVPGPVLGALGISLVNLFVSVYLPERISSASALYGALGAAVAVLFYMLLIAYTLVGMALVNAVWADRAEIIAGRPWVVDPDALPRWTQKPARWVTRLRGEDREDPPGDRGTGPR
jgi:uncharacterized BrkB/YihY/UPF0761 family membrane protein